ncbi:MAG: TolC family protein [Candidatus Omnitrophica bacterium]|nr:TolC family protein [Candidatus Omnitrophota bacterium]
MMNRQRTLCILLFCLCLIASPDVRGRAEEIALDPSALSLEAFCRRVLDYYPKLKQGDAAIEGAIAKRLQAQAGFLPRIQGLASMTTGNDQVYVFGTLLRQRAFREEDFTLSRLNNPPSRTDYTVGLYGEMPLFDALQTIYKVRQAKHLAGSARYDKEFSKMEAILIASDAYMRAVAVESLLTLVDRACTNSETDIKQAEELKDKGMVLGADFYAAKVILGNLRNMKNELIGQKQSMHALLNILMGEDPLSPLKLTDPLPEKNSLAKDIQEWLSEAYALRPDILSLEEAIHSQKAEVAREQATALPTISAFGDLEENTRNFSAGGGSFAVGLKGSVDIFDMSYPARVKIARETLKKLEYDKIIAHDAIAKDISDEYARQGALEANIPVLREMAGDAGQAVDLTAPLYSEGRKSIADLLAMRHGYIQTHRAYYSAMAGAVTSRARLLFLSGQLDETQCRQLTQGGN